MAEDSQQSTRALLHHHRRGPEAARPGRRELLHDARGHSARDALSLMMTLREVIARIADRLRRDRLSAELDEELRLHRAMLERDAGLAVDETRTSRRLGNLTY